MILALNCGSQSIKWKVFDNNLKLKGQNKKKVLKKGAFERILKKELKNLDFDIDLIGHRVVHGGEKFRKPAEITAKVVKDLKKYNKLAPLHNPYNLLGIKTAKKVFPRAKQTAVFDTEFYGSLPEVSRTYALPENLRKKYKKLGFHGISHEYAGREAARKIKKPFNKLKIISCHLGGGSSITAVKNGKAIDTSMGYTPMEGLIMMTRAGDIDPGVVVKLGRKAGKILNYESGMKGLAQEDDMLKILKRKDKKAKLALDIFVYRIKKYIGAYCAILGGCDLLVFTGVIGAGLAKTRRLILKDLKILKKTKVIIIKPNEELAIVKKMLKSYNK